MAEGMKSAQSPRCRLLDKVHRRIEARFWQNGQFVMATLNFRLMFPIEKVEWWASRYAYSKKDSVAFDAGKRIREGAHTRENLGKIVAWKSDRRKALIDENTDDEIRDALALALTRKRPGVRLLCS
jgi:hypothetical protein